MITIFGYSLLSFVPAAILAFMPFSIVQWALFLAACAHSMMFLSKNIAA